MTIATTEDGGQYAPAIAPNERTRSLQEWAAEAHAAGMLAQSLCKTAFAGQWRNDPDSAAAAILRGSELGLSPVTALGAFDNIQGTPAPKAMTLRAFVQAAGHGLRIVEETDTKAVAEYRRAGETKWSRTEFTIEEARSMNLLGKDNWKKQPKNMLVARVTSKAARLVASDVLLGIGYSSEELRDHREPMQEVRAEVIRPQELETGEAITDRTRREMFALFTRKGVAEADQLPGINHICGTAYESRADLTEADGMRVIGVLRTKPDVTVAETEDEAAIEAEVSGLEKGAES